MAIKKTQLYNHLWEAANALRGGMDASQYKDYVLSYLIGLLSFSPEKREKNLRFFFRSLNHSKCLS